MSANEPVSQGNEDANRETGKQLPPAWHFKQVTKLWWKVHVRWPNVIPSPHGHDHLYLLNRDTQRNAATRIPEEEQVRLDVVWGVELFGPAHVENFYQGLVKLGWDSERTGVTSQNALSWIKEQRIYGSQGVFNIGLVTRTDDKRTFRARHFAPIPREVDYLLVKIFQLTPSLSCVLIGFVLKEEVARCYETQLLQDRKFIHRRFKGRSGYATYGVDHLKRAAIDSARDALRNTVIQWFQKNLPGYFCGSDGGERMPTAELITSEHENLLKLRTERQTGSKWASLLIPNRLRDIWVQKERDYFRLAFYEVCDEAPFHTIITVRTAGISNRELEDRGGRSRMSIIEFVEDHVDGILSHHAAITLLREISRSLTLSREKLNTASIRHNGALGLVENIKSFFDQTIGLPTLLSDLQKKSETVAAFTWSCSEFQQSRSGNDEVRRIAEMLCAQMEYLSDRVLLDEISTRAHFEQIATIANTRESIKAQKRMEVLTVLVLVLTTLSLYVAIPETRWLEIKTYFDSCYRHHECFGGTQTLTEQSPP